MMNRLIVDSLKERREWLARNHGREPGVWLVFRKKKAGKVPFDYPQALDETLCYGWVDNLVRGIDQAPGRGPGTGSKIARSWKGTDRRYY